MTAMSVPEVLRRAEAIIGERGWCTEDYTDAEGRVCVEGSINVALGGVPGEPPEDREDLAVAAFRAMYDEVGSFPPRWNDEPGRTAEEVRAALLRAADRAVTE